MKEVQKPNKNARSLAIAKTGIKTSKEFGNMMAALMSDLVEGSITPMVANAVCNAGGKLLKGVEMSIKYGVKHDGRSILTLTHDRKD